MFLIINTTGRHDFILLGNSKKIIEYYSWSANNNHSESLLVLINRLFKKNKITKEQISAIGVVNGPGSYTGIRVGVATANAIAYAGGIDVIAVNILEIMADFYLNQFKAENVLSVMHAIYDKYYYAKYSLVKKQIKLLRFGNDKLSKIIHNKMNNVICLRNDKNNLNCNYIYSFNQKERSQLIELLMMKLNTKKATEKIIKPLYLNHPNIT